MYPCRSSQGHPRDQRRFDRVTHIWKGKPVKKAVCLLALLLALFSALPAQAALSRFDKAPKKTKIYEAHTDRSVTLLYGDERYAPGSIGMIYADRSTDEKKELPLLVVYFTHNGNKGNTTLTVTTDQKVYQVMLQSNLKKTGVAENPSAFNIAVGPDSIAMFQDMAKSKAVRITCGSAKNTYEIILTEEKRSLIKLIVAEYNGHIAKVYDAMDTLDRMKYVTIPAAEIQVSDKKPEAEPVYTELNAKSSGDAVKQLQRYLIEQGYLTGTADGKYSKAVVEAVKKFQRKAGLSPSGMADEKTQQKLYAKAIPWRPAITLSDSFLKSAKGAQSIRFFFRNVDCEYTVTGISVVFRLLDKKGKPIAVNGQTVFSQNVKKITLPPGKTRNNAKDELSLAGVSGVKQVEAGIVSYTIEGGKTVNVPTEQIQWAKFQ